LAEALGNVTTAHLLCLDNDCATAPDEAELLRAFRALEPAARQQILAAAKQKLGS
jgi:hypothetical protein